MADVVDPRDLRAELRKLASALDADLQRLTRAEEMLDIAQAQPRGRAWRGLTLGVWLAPTTALVWIGAVGLLVVALISTDDADIRLGLLALAAGPLVSAFGLYFVKRVITFPIEIRLQRQELLAELLALERRQRTDETADSRFDPLSHLDVMSSPDREEGLNSRPERENDD